MPRKITINTTKRCNSMLNGSTNPANYYFTDHDGSKLLPKGMSLICHYYRKKHNLNNMFSAANYNETFALIKKFKNNSNRFGIVYINTIAGKDTSTHKGAIVIDGEKAFILDSLGTGVGSGSKALKEYLIEENLFERDDIYISNVKMQRDHTSCGTLSFLFLKEALRMGDTFKEFMLANSFNKEVDTLPPNLLKYMQSLSDIAVRNTENDEYYAVYPEMPVRKQSSPKKTTETLIEYVERNKQSSPSNPYKQISVAASKRAEKHIRIIDELLESETLDQVEEEITSINSRDYSQEILGNIPIVFSFTPIKKEKPASSAVSDKGSDCDAGFDVFDFMLSASPIPTPQATPPRQTMSGAGSNKSTPTRTALREITNLSRRLELF